MSTGTKGNPHVFNGTFKRYRDVSIMKSFRRVKLLKNS
mgnify:CR=1 FL=1